jgi:hypothetical protein
MRTSSDASNFKLTSMFTSYDESSSLTSKSRNLMKLPGRSGKKPNRIWLIIVTLVIIGICIVGLRSLNAMSILLQATGVEVNPLVIFSLRTRGILVIPPILSVFGIWRYHLGKLEFAKAFALQASLAGMTMVYVVSAIIMGYLTMVKLFYRT